MQTATITAAASAPALAPIVVPVRGHLEAFQNTLVVSGGGVLSQSDG